MFTEASVVAVYFLGCTRTSCLGWLVCRLSVTATEALDRKGVCVVVKDSSCLIYFMWVVECSLSSDLNRGRGA